MLIIPMHKWMLDILLACNIAVAFTVMFGCMFAKEVLDLSFFPTILLFTTIFRIALNVSSTRLILTTGVPYIAIAGAVTAMLDRRHFLFWIEAGLLYNLYASLIYILC